MEKKLIKKWFKNPKFPYNSDNITNVKDANGHTIDIALVLSGRNLGKSFEICARRCILEAWESQGSSTFGYVRRKVKENNTFNVEQYFGDKADFIADITHNEYNKVSYYRRRLYFSRIDYDDEGEKKEVRSTFPIGYVFTIKDSADYKSLQFPTIDKLLFEELFPEDNIYLSEEVSLFLNLISTVKRKKDKFICYCISNKISRVNPYVNGFCLTRLARQKSGTIDIYRLERDEILEDGTRDYYLIGIEICQDAGSDKKSDSVVASTTSGSWTVKKVYPTINPNFINKYETVASFVFEFGAFKYLVRIKSVPFNIQELYNNVIYGSDIEEAPQRFNVLYVENKTGGTKPGTRLFTSQPLVNPYTTIGIKFTSEMDKQLAELLARGWVFYSDNLTGNEFNQVLSQFNRF